MRALLAFAVGWSGAAFAGDGPEISTSAGPRGGLVVLWPRIVPESAEPEITALAAEVQAWLAEVAGRTGRAVDVRPAPERACPRASGGCRATSVSAVLAHEGGGCALVAAMGGPGEAPVTLHPWVGRVQVREATVPFREPPEAGLRVADFVPCGEVRAQLAEREDLIVDALRAALVGEGT